VRRPAFLASIAVFAAARASRASAADPIRVGVSSSEESSLLFTAAERGFYKDAGLDVAVTVVPPNQMAQGVLGGLFDVGLSNTGAILLAHAHSLPMYLLAPAAVYSARQPISYLVVAPASPIATAKDFAGKTIGVFAIHDMASTALLLWLDTNGGDSKSVRMVEVPPLAQAAAVTAGRIDGAIMNEPHFSNAKGTLRQVGLTYAALAAGKPFQTTGVVVNKGWADANPALVRRFAGVVRQSAQWANRNPDAAAALIAQLMQMDLDVVKAIPRVQWGEALTPALVQPVIDVMAKYAVLPQRFPAQDLFVPGA
jgi:ABC-type nitrate/sulfonate/bicarbonate transport system substrate-binding protein